MVWNAMVFTLGHEYSHILLGHLEGAQTKKASGLAEAEMFVRSPEQEFKADEVGFRFAVLWSRATHKAEPIEDVEAFTDAIAFNWLIAGTDAHAKNYSLLIGSGAAVRLAPIYDLARILPYRAASLRRVKLAMKIGGEYRLSNIGLRHWQRMATELRLNEEALIDRVRAMAATLPDTVTEVQARTGEEGLSHVTILKLAERLKLRAVSCLRILQSK